MAANELLEQIIQKSKDLDAEIKAFGQAGLKSVFTDFFNDNEWCEAVTWNQYTPYFNDGDECVFGVGDPSFKFTDAFVAEKGIQDLVEEHEDDDGREGFFESLEIFYYTGEYETYKDYRGVEQRRQKYAYKPLFEGSDLYQEKMKEYRKFHFTSELKEIYKAAFGDHSEVVATREGFQVDHYDHD